LTNSLATAISHKNENPEVHSFGAFALGSTLFYRPIRLLAKSNISLSGRFVNIESPSNHPQRKRRFPKEASRVFCLS